MLFIFNCEMNLMSQSKTFEVHFVVTRNMGDVM